jgi:hypothetical protein
MVRNIALNFNPLEKMICQIKEYKRDQTIQNHGKIRLKIHFIGNNKKYVQ